LVKDIEKWQKHKEPTQLTGRIPSIGFYHGGKQKGLNFLLVISVGLVCTGNF